MGPVRTLFAGWRPDQAGRDHLSRLASAVQAARPADAPRLKLRRADQWHVTLCFIGHDVDAAVVAKARDALDGVPAHVPPHAWQVARMAYWPGSGALVALAGRDDPLQALCDACADALRGAGIRPAQVTSQPHLTLAYLPRHLPPQPWLAAVDCDLPALRVDRFELLGNPGGGYEAVAEWPLGGAEPGTGPRQPALF